MTELQAYKTMFRFLEDRYFRLPSDALVACRRLNISVVTYV
jgi:hypothetical protein